MKTRDRLVLLILMLGFLVLLLKNAWVSDDAYITFRTVENFVSGNGLVWNLGERVQSYSHPLWMFALSAIFFITGELFYSTTFLSIAISLATVFLFIKLIANSVRAALLAWLLLTCSKAFVDYSTSGLENPLTHLILILFFWRASAEQTGTRHHFALGLVAALGVVNRHDTVLLFLPVLCANLIARGWPRILGAYLLAGVPFFLWEAFSIIYYGFPFPNTAYAKLSTGLPINELLAQGRYYYLDALKNDPITIGVIGLGFLSSFIGNRRLRLPLGFGLLFYLLYIVRIGGDFMSGRFFSAPFILSLCLLSTSGLIRRRWASIAAVVFAGIVTLLMPRSPWRTGIEFGSESDKSALRNSRGIADERAYYFQALGFVPYLKRGGPREDFIFVRIGREIRRSGCRVALIETAGLTGFELGRGVHAVDRWALTDPLLARLPADRSDRWRIGHFVRYAPAGYIESLVFKTNRIRDPDLARVYDQLLLVVRGPIFDPERWRAIAALNLGRYSGLSDKPLDRHEDENRRWALALHFRAEDLLPREDSETLPADRKVGVPITPRGIAVHFRNVEKGEALDVSLTPARRYRILFFLDSKYLGLIDLDVPAQDDFEPAPGRIPLPPVVRTAGFNSLVILSRESPTSPPYLRSLRLLVDSAGTSSR